MKIKSLIFAFILITGFLLIFGCGSKDGINTRDVNELWENQILRIATLITDLEEAKEPQRVTGAITAFTRGLEENIPQFNELYAKYPAFNERIQKETAKGDELSPETIEKKEAMIKLIAVGLFTENIGKIQSQRYQDQAGMREPLQKLAEIQATMNLGETLRSESEVGVQYNNLVGGRMSGSPKVQKFFDKLRKAGVTSMLKLTIREIIVMGKAIRAFINDKGYAPGVTELDELKTYEDFIPKYIDDEKSLRLEDAWGNYLYYKAEGSNYWIGSAGSDGNFLGFDQEGSYTEMEGNDVVLSNDRFIYFPQFKKNTAKDTQ